MKFILIVITSLTIAFATKAQNNYAQNNYEFYKYGNAQKKNRYRIAVLTPMYLDSFDLRKNLANLPKSVQAGLDFYQGAMIAADTLNKMGNQLNIYMYDSKSEHLNLQTLIESDKLDSVDVIIGNVGGADLKLMGEFAKAHKINFVSAVSPADADQKNNPFFTLLQPRLSSHIQRIHKQIVSKQPSADVIFIHRNIQNETNAYNYFINDAANTSINPVKENVLNGDLIEENFLQKNLDSNKENVVVMAILDPLIAYKNLKIINKYSLKGYRIKVYGMPTWENIKALKNAEVLPETNVYITTPMMIDKYTAGNKFINDMYKQKMGTAASDIVYKGFESVFFFANLMNKYGIPFNNFISDNSNTFITPYKIVPNFDSNNNFMYFENKFLYIIRFQNGTMTYE